MQKSTMTIKKMLPKIHQKYPVCHRRKCAAGTNNPHNQSNVNQSCTLLRSVFFLL